MINFEKPETTIELHEVFNTPAKIKQIYDEICTTGKYRGNMVKSIKGVDMPTCQTDLYTLIIKVYKT